MKSRAIRQAFFDFFKKKQHEIVASAPIVLKDDPTLMFTNAGMNQFKDYFLGYKEPKSVRIADTQKCLRVSGKHNDLDEVGHDTYHHTMFEMLGNWSFGDYFKEEAIAWAWELLTKVYEIPIDNIYVSVFEGDKTDNLPKDIDAINIWKKYIAEDRILEFDKKDNFWEMGETGPCGPCSEIHVDLRSEEEKAKISGKELINADHPQVVEVWNLVFMEFMRKADGSLEKLPQKHIDTGMGFERLCMAIQKKASNYDTDVFMPIINQIETISGKTYGENEEDDIAIRVVADHLRAVSFAIADGQLPSNNGAGYVIRRILRRAISYGYRFLNQKEPFIYRLVDILEKEMGEFFPEIIKQKELIVNVIKEEEVSFLRTLEQGLNRISQIIEKNKKEGKTIIEGKVVFELYDTFGFPTDLSALVAENFGMTIDEKGFEKHMQDQKDRARKASESETGDWVVILEDEKEEFIGYDYLEADVKITKYRKVTNKKGSFYQIAFNFTPFYAESGGQVGDTGYIEALGEKITILDTKKENNLIIHITKTLPKTPEATFKAFVDKKRRDAITKNHTATHLLHQALREVLGDHVEQRGSHVSEDRLRFDFSHFSKITEEEMQQIEEIVFKNIIAGHPLEENRSVPINVAIEKGAMALFGEKYDDVVRTIGFGDSFELCGGCHVKSTTDIMMFHIESESSIASGIRRIEAITGQKAIDHLKKHFTEYSDVLKILKNPKEPVKAIESIQKENNELRKQVEQFIKEKALVAKDEWINKAEKIGDITFISEKTDLDAGAVKSIAFQLKGKIDNLFMIIGSTANQKPVLTVFISEDLVSSKSLNAGTIVRELGQFIKGGGGGQAFFATAGGKEIGGIDQALQEAKKYLN
ncbi:alanine--tRNA ligase [Flavobacteriaceae bacterium UJ101]|nr:alanine--tRNA ligase [Flavobacteriaceae bacterium UJ101]